MKHYKKDKGIPNAFFNGGEYLIGLPAGDELTPESRVETLKRVLIEKISKINSISTPIKLP
jgi:hypothetical protein